MVEMEQYKYSPDYVVAPGEVLEETIEARNIKKVDLAMRCSLSTKTVSQILSGKAPISPETALQLQRVLGVSANIWNNLEANYRLFLEKRDSRKELSKHVAWSRKFPIKELVERGFMPGSDDPVEGVEQLLVFFGVGSVQAWEARFSQLQVSFRHSPSFKSSRESIAAWLRIGELCAEKVDCKPYDKKRLLDALYKIRTLTAEPPEVFGPKIREMFADAGVALAFVAELPETHLSGATRWVTKDKPLIVLSLRHKTDDRFWFSLFHEAGHILFGGKKLIFLDEINTWTDTEETRADEFASNILIPRQTYADFIEKRIFTHTSVQTFSQQLGIAPGIIVGRLQHERVISWRLLNNLKRKFELVEACD